MGHSFRPWVGRWERRKRLRRPFRFPGGSRLSSGPVGSGSTGCRRGHSRRCMMSLIHQNQFVSSLNLLAQDVDAWSRRTRPRRARANAGAAAVNARYRRTARRVNARITSRHRMVAGRTDGSRKVCDFPGCHVRPPPTVVRRLARCRVCGPRFGPASFWQPELDALTMWRMPRICGVRDPDAGGGTRRERVTAPGRGGT